MIKILIIRFSSIGDIVLTSPVLRCLKQQLQGCEVHYLTKESFKGIVIHNPHISKVYTIAKDVKEVMPHLKAEKYDYIIDLHHNLRSLQVKAALRKKYFSFPKLNFEKWLMVNLKINLLPAMHVVERYFEAVRKLNVVNDGNGLDYFISKNEEVDIITLPSTHQQGYIGIVIGAKHYTKKLPDDKIIALCQLLDQPIILLGGKEDFERGKDIASATGNNIYNACGKYSLNQSASLIRQSLLIITNDTGLMHIAAAFKKKIISTWGNTIPEFGMSQYYGNTVVPNWLFEIKDLPCRPCSKIGFENCPKGHFKCMRDIDVLQIYKAAEELLSENGRIKIEF